MSWRTTLAVMFLAGQAASVVGILFHEGRWFAWAPHTVQVHYWIEATVDGRALDSAGIHQRLGLRADAWEVHAARHLEDIIDQYVRTDGQQERLTLTLRYTVNGRSGHLRTWTTDVGR